jgi:hypothetical protein
MTKIFHARDDEGSGPYFAKRQSALDYARAERDATGEQYEVVMHTLLSGSLAVVACAMKNGQWSVEQKLVRVYKRKR